MEKLKYIKNHTEREAEEYLKFMNDTDVSERKHECKVVTQKQQKLYTENLAKSYRECDFTYKPKSNLSVLPMKNTILSMIETNTVVVIQGPTGCGKTTQIPQLILDANTKKRLHCNIIVTQPRRIAAISIAKRVSQEGGWPLGSVVGYHVGMEQQISDDTRLTFCTTEILLQRLIRRKNMLDYTHIILDEIHERNQEMDFLLLVVKKLLQTNSSLVKVVLMSATINVKKFADYFSIRVRNNLVPAPLIEIPDKGCFETYTYYLDQLKDLGAIPEVVPSEPRVTQSMINFCAKIIMAFDQIDANDSNDNSNEKEGEGETSISSSQRHTVLIFLPGIYEIEELYTFLSSKCYEDRLWDLVMLHSMISSDEQQRVFYKTPARHRRIILSTNIAESSITVPDVKYVIDFCLVKMVVLDPVSNYQSLQLCWASKTSCVQRAGRAGRVMDGRVYRLVPKMFYRNMLDDEGVPEILRAPLANVVLRAKIFDFDDPRSLLALSLDPPSLQNLSSTILHLKETGALMNDHAAFQPFDGELTDMGRIMALLPLDIQISKLIMLGHIFGILRDAVVLGASMALKDMFIQNVCRGNVSSYSTKRKWARETGSDCIAALNVYKMWQNEKANRRFTSYQAEKQWAQRNGVQLRTLRELDVLVNEITYRLTSLGVKETVGVRKVIWKDRERDFVLQVIIAGAFYPNYFIKHSHNIEIHETDVVKNLNALDPLKTIYMRGWPAKQPGYLYAKRLQEIFAQYHGIPKERIMVSFDGSMRVYVQYCEKETTNSDESLYRISDFVYMSVKMRHCEIPIKIGLLNTKKAQEKSKNEDLDRFEKTVFFKKETSKTRNNMFKIRPELPGLDVTFIPLSIQNIVSPGYFWAILNDDDIYKKIRRIEIALNAHPLRKYRFPPKIKTIVAAPMERNDSLTTYHRATVEEYTMEIVNVFFIDHGRTSQVRSSDLRVIDDVAISKLPCLAFRCALASIRPSYETGNFQGRWSRVSRDCFEAQIHESKTIFGQIYSVANSTVNLEELIIINKNNEKLNMNQYLIEKGHAINRKESFLSKYNHDMRVELSVVNSMSSEERSFYEEQQYDENNFSEYPCLPEEEDCDSWVQLQGPYSPLEINIIQLTAAGKSKRAIVDNNSVNSVLLDENSDRSTRLLVAQSVHQLNDSNHLSLRNSTLLPNVPGLTALLALIFAPRIELRCNILGTYYTGALCGLGPMDTCTDRSIFPDHDMEISFDVEISSDDLREINKLRHWMNAGMQLPNNKNNNFDNDSDDGDEQIINCQNHVKRALLELRDRRRRSQDSFEFADSGQWNRYHESFFLHAVRDVKKGEMYPLHKALKLRERNDQLERIVRHLVELYQLSNGDTRKMGNVSAYCKLCEVETFSQLNLRGHLYSKQHIKNEESLQIPNLREYCYRYY